MWKLALVFILSIPGFAKAETCANYFLFDGGREEILFAPGLGVDSELDQWIQKIRAKYNGNKNALEVATEISKDLDLDWSDKGLKGILKRIWFRLKLDRGNFEVRRAGEYLKLCYGVCRHRSAILTFSLRELGFNADYVSGDLRTDNDSEQHAWVIVEHEREQYLFDPMNTWIAMGIKLKPTNMYFRGFSYLKQTVHPNSHNTFTYAWSYRNRFRNLSKDEVLKLIKD